MIAEQARTLVKSMQQPDRYDDSVEKVDVLQTHMSWILLAGRYAYKIKKPVDLGFADFSSLDQRRHYCVEELRVNRRLAPHLYLDVVTITGDFETPQLDGKGDAIEYAVKMKRFPQSELLPRVLERGDLSYRHLEELARAVARFHGNVDVDNASGPYGTPDSVWAPMAANFEHFEREANLGASRKAQLQRLRDWSEREFAVNRIRFKNRKAEGFIRECHGDMHLGNMVLQDDSITVFDSIEFSPRLRWIDVINEIAFLVMDLVSRDCPEFANHFLNSYLEQTGDYHGLMVLRYYLVYRALVRAKVKSLRLGQRQGDEAARENLQDQVGRYLDVAEEFTEEPSPRLWIAHGVSGSGKTQGTQPLVDRKGMIRIRSDIERKRLFGYAPSDHTGSGVEQGLYSQAGTRRTYRQLANLASTVVRAGFSAVVDATFLKRWQRDLLRETAEELSVPFHILDFRAPRKVLGRRIARRARDMEDASDADIAVVSHQLRTRERLAQDEQASVIHVDTKGPRQHRRPYGARR